VILTTLAILTQYLKGQQAVVFAKQFFCYIQGNPKAQVAPDVMVVFDIPTGMRTIIKYGKIKYGKKVKYQALFLR
jgi:DUF917 family protein